MHPSFRLAALALVPLLASCRKSPPPPPPPMPQHPVSMSTAALPTPADMTQLLAHPELGTAGDFTRNTSATPVGALDAGVFRPHAAIAATLVGPAADWTLVLAESGLFLLDDSLATRARLTLDGEELEGDLSASPDGSRFAVGAKEGAAHGVDVREWPSLTRVRFVPTAVVSRIRWSQTGTEIAACSRDGASTTLVTVATGATEVYPSTAKVNDATFIGKGAFAYGNDDDTTLALQRRTNAPWFDHLASIHRSVRRDQNAVIYDSAHDRLYTGGNDNDVWIYEHVSTGAPVGGKSVELENDVSDFHLLPSGDLVVALDSASLDVVKRDGTVQPLLGQSVGMVSYGARIDGRGDRIVGVLGRTVFRHRFGDAHTAQAPFFGNYGELRQFDGDPASEYREVQGEHLSRHVVVLPTSAPDPLRAAAIDLGVPPVTPCAAVHDGVVCVSDHGALTMSGAPRGATTFGPPTTLAPNASSTHATSRYMVAIDDGGAVFVVDAHGATRIGRVAKGAWAGMAHRNAKTGQWELMGEPIR